MLFYNEKEQRFNIIQLNVLGESYYPGAYNFQQDLEGWTDESGTDCSANVTGIKEGHSGVVHLVDNSDYQAILQLDLNPAKANDIEFWVYPDTSCHTVIEAYQGDDTDRCLYIQFLAGSNIIRYYDGSYHNVMSYSEQWYHFRLDFNFGTNHWNLYIDQILKASNIPCEAPWTFDIGIIKYYTWTSGSYSRGETYFDSVGLIGYDGYAQGDNLDTYSCTGTPFVEGPNAIVIPTSLFTKTLLHHYIENGELENTVLYSDVEGLFEMISIERDGTQDVACGDVDYVFIRYDISPEDALEVLNLVLNGFIEEILDENNNTVYINGTIHEYLSSKFDGINANKLNIPFAALNYIPWFMTVQNSPCGITPYPADPLMMFFWWITWLCPFLHLIVIYNMAMIAAEKMGYLIGFADSIFMKLLTALGDLMWLLVRAAILVFAYIEFALLLIIFVSTFIFLATTFLLLSIFLSGSTFTAECNSISLIRDTHYFTFIYDFALVYIDYFDIEIPTLSLKYQTDVSSSILNFNIFQMAPTIPLEHIASFTSNAIQSPSPESSNYGLKTSDSSSEGIDPYVVKGFTLFFTIISAIIAMIGLQSLMEGNDAVEWALFILSMIILITSLYTLVISSINKEKDAKVSEGMLGGYIMGWMFSVMFSIVIYSITSSLKISSTNLQSFLITLQLLILIYTLSSDISDILFASFNIELSAEVLGDKVILDLGLATFGIIIG